MAMKTDEIEQNVKDKSSIVLSEYAERLESHVIYRYVEKIIDLVKLDSSHTSTQNVFIRSKPEVWFLT